MNKIKIPKIFRFRELDYEILLSKEVTVLLAQF